ncbi:hypothetical protein RRG08_059426 [Elysia crispata]|uniref:Uncharacterized protein n=1 Tax=Elysia crispata TaxID=231223 RepID=A0AAE1DRW9_9GAST|nr:hypothetical protein RRG08_059426 [Elysia crispata]
MLAGSMSAPVRMIVNDEHLVKETTSLMNSALLDLTEGVRNKDLWDMTVLCWPAARTPVVVIITPEEGAANSV